MYYHIRELLDPPEIDIPIFLKLSFDELNQHVAGDKYHRHRWNGTKNIRVLKALSASSKYH